MKRLTDAAITPAYLPTAEFKTFIDEELVRWGRRIPSAGILPE